MRVEDSPHDILINLNAEGIGDLLGNPRTAEAWIAPFHLDYETNQFWLRTFRAGFGAGTKGKKPIILVLDEGCMKSP